MNIPAIDGVDVAGIVSLLLVLVLWCRSLMAKKASDEALDRKLLERQERIDAERARQATPQDIAPVDPAQKSGPWG